MNDDVIYRQAAIDALDCISGVEEVLRSLPPAQPERKWIPCSERLPKVNEKVLATTVWNDVTTAWRIGIDKWFIHDGGANATTEDLNAWMPLPRPYHNS